MVSWLSVASHGTAEANVKVMLQVVIAGAAVWFVCLGNRTSTCILQFPTSLSLCFSHIRCGQLDGSSCHPPSWCVVQDSKYTFLMILLYLSLWHSHSLCFLLGFLLSTVVVWLKSSRRCDMRMPARLQRFSVPTGLHPFLLHPHPVRMLVTPDIESPLLYSLTTVSQ